MRRLRITIDDKSYDVTVEDLTEPEGYHAAPAAPIPTPTATVQSPVSAAPPGSHAPPGAGSITSPMAGVIKTIMVNAGDRVTERQLLLMLEAMKMENKITAPKSGTVKSVNVKEGDSVNEGQVLLVVE